MNSGNEVLAMLAWKPRCKVSIIFRETLSPSLICCRSSPVTSSLLFVQEFFSQAFYLKLAGITLLEMKASLTYLNTLQNIEQFDDVLFVLLSCLFLSLDLEAYFPSAVLILGALYLELNDSSGLYIR
jgi:hypothetical protein